MPESVVRVTADQLSLPSPAAYGETENPELEPEIPIHNNVN